ncbi:unnamed protein product, partial [Urochloa humidicola]
GVPGGLFDLPPPCLHRQQCQRGHLHDHQQLQLHDVAGGGVQLNPGQTWTLNVPVGTSGRIWGRTGCSFNGNGSNGNCTTGDCAGELSCRGLGNPPSTLAEYTIGSSGGAQQDFYDISIIDGYNLAMDFSCTTGKALKCRQQGCADAILFPDDRVRSCRAGQQLLPGDLLLV